MKREMKRSIPGVVASVAVWLSSVVFVNGQAGPATPPLSEQVFKNVQVLKGIPVNEFMGTMGVFSAALGMSCEDCHAAGDADWSVYAKDSPRKLMARVMVTMMATINKTHFGGRQVVTCYTCHRGSARPRATADLAELYGTPPGADQNVVFEQARGAPSPEEVLDKYVQAIGGAQRLTALTSFVAKGTRVGYGPDSEPSAAEIFARRGQRTTIVHTSGGDSTTTYDGRAGWIAAPFRPVAVLALSDQDVDGLKLEADLSFPNGIKQALTKWRVGPAAVIDDHEVQVVQGTTARGATATLYFDMESGLLVRSIRYTDSPVGRIPTQTDYSDYRDVSGVKMPFKWTKTWLDGRDTFEITAVQPNVAIDTARFAKPSAPVAK
ncbi:MAG TPA: photosynthetic reaction center cytochrome c subunit family protein [Vicinamibacterales bacterium]|nr:photosynthetic reaction center cytochrome c subunit family protein [Vicinamibacterales bacterium]